MRKLFYEDKELHDFMMLAHYTTNYNMQEYQGLKQFEFPFSHRRFMKLTGLADKKLRAVTSELINRNSIEWTEKSKSKHISSKMKNLMAKKTHEELGHSESIENNITEEETDTVNNGHSKSHSESHGKRHSKTVKNTIIEEKNDTVDDAEKATVNDTLSNKYNLINKSNIYIVQQAEELWQLYPSKIGKGKVINKIPKLIEKEGYEQLKSCIERYMRYVEKRRNEGFKELKYQNGSTFFNSGYIDYLDANYEEVINSNINSKEKEKPKNLLGWD